MKFLKENKKIEKSLELGNDDGSLMMTFENHVTLSQFLENSKILIEDPSIQQEEKNKVEEEKTDSIMEYEKCKNFNQALSLLADQKTQERIAPTKIFLKNERNNSIQSCEKMCYIF